MKSEYKRHFIIISDNSDKKIAIDFVDYKTEDLKAIIKRIKSECGEISLSVHCLHTKYSDWDEIVQNKDDYFKDICLINSVDDFIECLKRNNENDKKYVRLTMEEYQALVEENKKLKDRLNFIFRTKHNDKIKNPLAFTSGMCCIHCDHKDEYIIDLEADNEELKKYLKEAIKDMSVVANCSNNKCLYCSKCKTKCIFTWKYEKEVKELLR